MRLATLGMVVLMGCGRFRFDAVDPNGRDAPPGTPDADPTDALPRLDALGPSAIIYTPTS